ncbi:MAG: APC family permease [Pseudonocardiaceae bacterium]
MTQPLSTTAAASSGLRPNALGFPALLAQSIALISPTMTAVLIIPLAFSNAGQGTWLAYLFGTAMLLFVVFNLNQFARRSTSPGSMYAYTGRGLGAVGGVFSGWTLIWSYLFIGVAGMTGFTIFSRQFLDIVGIHTSVPAFVFFAISAVLCWTLGVQDIRLSSMLTLILEGLSVLCILALAAIVLLKHGIVVDSDQIHLKGVTFRGMSLAVVACIFSLVGFESATALGGEARTPLQTIPKAVICSLILTGLFFVCMGYVEVFGTRGQHDTLDTLATPLNTLAELNKVSYFALPLSLGAMISFFALSLSCLNSGARIIYPMARHSVFPARLGKVHPSNATPAAALSAYILVMFTVPAIWSTQTNVQTVFNDAGTLAAFGFLLAYFMVSVAAPMHLRKLGELKPGNVAVAVLALVFLLIPTVGSFYPLPAYPVDLFPYIFLTYLALGGAWLFIASRRRRGILGEIKTDLELEKPMNPIHPPQVETSQS